jgi:mandelate racemase
VQLGENWWNARQAARSIGCGACDEVMLDVMKIGGITGWLDAAAVARAAGMRISSHIFPEVSAHLLAGSAGAHYLEWLDLASGILRTPIRPSDGRIAPADDAGTGLVWDEDAVARYTLD